MRITVASKNPVKIKCTELAFQQVFNNTPFTIHGVDVPSDVADQPMSDEETRQGAINRAKNAKVSNPKADFWVGIEGGIQENEDGEMLAFAWVHILSENQQGQSRTATFTLPPKITALIHQGIELGKADDIVFKRENSKQKSGAVGILTHDLIGRVEYYQPAVVLALIPFINPTLYT